MNTAAEKHLSKAKTYLAKGDEFYRKAKPEIEAAVAAGASHREVARFLAKSHTWVQDVLSWDGKGTLYGKDTGRRQLDFARQVLRENPEAVAKEITVAMRDPDLVREVVKDQQAHREAFMATHQTTRVPHAPPADPSFINLIVRISNSLIQLEGMLWDFEDASEIPPEFSEASMDDIAAKAMRIKELVKSLRSESNDEWQRIVRELRGTP